MSCFHATVTPHYVYIVKNCPLNPFLPPLPIHTEAIVDVLTQQRKQLISEQMISLLPLAPDRGGGIRVVWEVVDVDS